jgi:hypothetical protein
VLFVSASSCCEEFVSENVEFNCLMQYEEVKKKGKTHMKFVSGKGTFKPSSIVFHFDNLFNGDKLLGDEINRVVNENWKLLFEDIEDTFLDATTKILINILNHFFSKVSIEEAFDYNRIFGKEFFCKLLLLFFFVQVIRIIVEK